MLMTIISYHVYLRLGRRAWNWTYWTAGHPRRPENPDGSETYSGPLLIRLISLQMSNPVKKKDILLDSIFHLIILYNWSKIAFVHLDFSHWLGHWSWSTQSLGISHCTFRANLARVYSVLFLCIQQTYMIQSCVVFVHNALFLITFIN